MLENEVVLILDFGGQYSQLIARRVRDLKVYCEIKPYHIKAEKIRESGYKGIIFSGGPNSVYEKGAPVCDPEIFTLGIPVLGICYGAQLMANVLGGTVAQSPVREYGKTEVAFQQDNLLLKNMQAQSVCWMSHTDYIAAAPQGFSVVARSADCPVAAMEHVDKKLFAVQFHPEVEHSAEGNILLKNFLYEVCGCSGDWQMSSFVKAAIGQIRARVGQRRVLCALSGGVDSSVAAVMVHKAIGKNLTCIFVDHGMLRKNEGDEVEQVFRRQFDMNLIRVDAFYQGWRVFPNLRKNGRSSAKNLSVYLKKSQKNWAGWIFSARGRFTRMWLRAEPARRLLSRATTTSAAYLKILALREL